MYFYFKILVYLFQFSFILSSLPFSDLLWQLSCIWLLSSLNWVGSEFGCLEFSATLVAVLSSSWQRYTFGVEGKACPLTPTNWYLYVLLFLKRWLENLRPPSINKVTIPFGNYAKDFGVIQDKKIHWNCQMEKAIRQVNS